MSSDRRATVAAVAILVLALAGAAVAQQMGGDVPGLQQYPLTAGQRQEITGIRQQTQQQVRQIQRQPGLTAQERSAMIRQARAQGHQQVLNALSPQQRQEFQTWWQGRTGLAPGERVGAGPRAPAGMRFGDVPGLSTPLTLDQRHQVDAVRQRAARDVRNVRIQPGLTQQQRMAETAQIRQQAHQDVLNVLTPQQRQEFQTWWQARGPEAVGPAGLGAGPGVAPGTQPGMQPGANNTIQ